MAYAWDKTKSVLGLTDPEEQQQGQSQDVVSSTEGEISGGPAGSSTPQVTAPQAQQTTSTPVAGGRAAVMKRNVGKSEAPADLGKMAGTVTGARQALQNEANTYLEAADDPDEQRLGQAGQAVKQYAETGQKADWLDQLNSKRYVSGPDLKTNTEVEDIGLLKNDAGIRELYRRQQDPEGTMGEAALDTALLRGNQEFGKTRDLLMKDYSGLQEERMKMPETLRTDAQARADATAEKLRKSVMGEAEGLASGYDTIAKQREAEFDAELQSLEAARAARMQEDAQAFLNEMAASGSYDPYVARALQQALGEGTMYNPDILDVSQFYTPGMSADSTSFEQFYGEPEAQGFERIMSLLGKGDTRMAGPYVGKKASDVLGGGLNKEALSQKALEYAAKYGGGLRGSEEQMAADAADKKQRQEDSAARTADANAKALSGRIAEMNRKGIAKEEMNAQDRALYDQMTPEQQRAYDESMDVSWDKRDPNKWIV